MTTAPPGTDGDWNMLGIDHSLRQIMISRDSHRNGHRKRRTIQPFGSRHHRCCGWSSGASKTILVHLHRLGGRRPWLEQTGSDGKTKIRRGEDWRRSGHNATCIMHDQPFHHPYWHASNTTTTDHSKFGDMATEEPIDNYHYRSSTSARTPPGSAVFWLMCLPS